jgi:cytochrome c-type biogenesis protein CcsB
MPLDTGLAAVSDNLLIAAILCYAVAMLAYAAEYSFGHRQRGTAIGDAVVEGAVDSRSLVGTAAVGGGAGPIIDESDSAASSAASSATVTATGPAAGTGGRRVVRRSAASWIGRGAVLLTAVGLLLHGGVLVTRAFAAHRVPWGNMYEFAVSVCFVAVLAWLVVLVHQSAGRSGEQRQAVRHLGVFVMLPVVLLLGLAGTVLYTRVEPLVPALNSYWLKIHVLAAVIASGAFLVSFATAVLYLVRDKYDRATAAGRPLRFPATLGPKLPLAENLERLTFRVIAFAFPVWTFAIIAGAIWAEAAWSRYWGWDPKETWAFISWVVYAAYLHARSTAGWRGRKAIWVAVLGWLTMMINLFAVNLIITGLHSYAGLQ